MHPQTRIRQFMLSIWKSTAKRMIQRAGISLKVLRRLEHMDPYPAISFELNPQTGILEPVVEVTFDFEEPLKANIVERRIGPIRTKAEEDRLRRNLRANRDHAIGIYTQEELIECLDEIDGIYTKDLEKIEK
jgi:hypothetical protein